MNPLRPRRALAAFAPTLLCVMTCPPYAVSEADTAGLRRSHLIEPGAKAPVSVAEPSQGEGPLPVTVILHGLCNDPRPYCEWFSTSELDHDWQLCPRGPVACGGASYQWGGAPGATRDIVDGAVEALDADQPGRVASGGAVLVGFSQGAFAAVSAVTTTKTKFGGLVLVAAKVAPDPKALVAAGVRRVALAVGDYDAARGAMHALIKGLERAGLEVRWVSLGKVGHEFRRDSSAPLAEAIEWARATAKDDPGHLPDGAPGPSRAP